MTSAQRPTGATAVAAAAVVLGAMAEWVAYRDAGIRVWGPDLAVGWGLVACGLVLRRVTPGSRSGLLLCATGLSWFAGNFTVVDTSIVAWVAEHTAYVHRAFLAHAVLAFPRGRLVPLPRRVVVAAVYLASLWPALATSDTAWVILGGAVLLAGVTLGDRTAGPGAALFALCVGGVAAARTFLGPLDPDAVLHLYEAGLVATGLVLVLMAAASASTVADRVIELGETASVQDALRQALSDSSLELAFVRNGRHIDERGRVIESPLPADRRVTVLGPSGDTVLIHSPAVVVDGVLADAVWRALRLTTENARLQADVFEQLADLRASRRRLVLARDRQRALIARRMREGAESHLAEIEEMLGRIESSDAVVGRAVERARIQLHEALEGIASLALGLQPRVLASEGLARALSVLAERSSVPVSLSVDERRFDAAVERTAYLVCSEALANVAKHASATCAQVRVETCDARLRIEVADDGRGGANPSGPGLRGLEERVEELGGSLRVSSPRGGGTRIRGEIPLHTERDSPRSLDAARRLRHAAATATS